MKKYKNLLAVDSLKILISSVFVAFVIYPFTRMAVNIKDDDFSRIIHNPAFGSAVVNSVFTAFVTTLISVSLSLLLAYCLQRTSIHFKTLLSVLLITPMLIPSITHGMSLIALFGTNGILTKALNIDSTIYGYKGIILASVLYSYPVAFLMLNDVLKYEDASPYEAARVLGIPKMKRFEAITIPYLRKPLISASFAVFTMCITDYGIPLMIGGKKTTLAVMMYQQVLGDLDFGKGAVIGLFLLIPAVVTFIYNTFIKEMAKDSYITKPFDIKQSVLGSLMSGTVCWLFVGCIALLILCIFAIGFTVQFPSNKTLTFTNVYKMLSLNGDKYMVNSVIIAICVSAVGVITAFTTAYLTSRIPSKLSVFLHLFSITSLAIPGIVLGLSYSMTFSGSFIYGTLAILILANLMHFFASPYLMMYNSLGKMNENIENVGKTMGISRLRIIFDVIIPQCKSTLFEMFSYFFVNSMMTISAVSFLSTASTKPVSLMINQFEAQMQLSSAAIVSIMILLVNAAIKVSVYLINKRL